MLKRHLPASFPVLVFVCGLVASPLAFAQCGCCLLYTSRCV